MRFSDLYLIISLIVLSCAVTSWLTRDHNPAPEPLAYTEVKAHEFTDVMGLNLWLSAHPAWDVVSVEGGRVWLTRRTNE